MAHGAPDDSNVVREGMVYRLDDLGELAARLGSPVKYHRLGDVVFIDDFESGLNHWETLTPGTGAFVRITNSSSLSKGSCLLLNSGTASILATYVHGFSPPLMGAGIGFHIALSLRANIHQWNLMLRVHKATYYTQYSVNWEEVADVLAYRTSTGGFGTVVASPGLVKQDSLFHHLKLIVDQDLEEYKGVYLDDVFYSLVGEGGYRCTPSGGRHIEYYIGVVGDHTNAMEIAVDDFVITVNEP